MCEKAEMKAEFDIAFSCQNIANGCCRIADFNDSKSCKICFRLCFEQRMRNKSTMEHGKCKERNESLMKISHEIFYYASQRLFKPLMDGNMENVEIH